jgi:phenylacetate-CoA ligase
MVYGKIYEREKHMNWRNLIVEPFYFKNIDYSEYRLENILKHAINNTKYYSQFKNKSLEEFPILTKDIIRENFENLKSNDLDKRNWFLNTSGGSTGEPVKFIQDMEFRNIQRVLAYEQKSWTGYKFGELMVKLWGNDKEILSDKKNYKAIFLDWLKNVYFLNSYSLTKEKIEKYINYLNEKQPKLLLSYIQSIYQLAKYAKDNNIKVNKLNAIMTTAGTLHKNQKELIEEVFQTKVYNRYGSREVGNIAASKNSDELIVSKGVFLEVLTKNGKITKNGIGDILVTSLINYAMPLIRYNIGDVAELKTEGDIQIIKKLYGRDVDMFKTKNGDFVDGEYFSDLFYFMEWVYKYQVIQKDYDYILVKIATKSPNYEDLEYIKKGIKKIMGECKIDIKILEDIPQLSSGKFRYTISEIR